MFDFNPPSAVRTDPPDVSFIHAMAECGLSPGTVVMDGTLTRFDIEARGDKAGWYVFYNDGTCPAGSFGNWRTGLKKTWSHKPEKEMTADEIEGFRRHVAEMKAKRQAEEERLHAEAKAKADSTWPDMKPAPDDHPYLVAKGVKSYGLRVTDDGRLVVPMFDIFSDLHSLQYIGEKKLFLPGGAVKGNYFTIPGNDTVYLCEGYATGATIHEATGGTVVVAFNAGNLKPVALNIKSKFPSSQIIVCADNDTETKAADGRMNPGVIAATEAAAAINAKLIIPTFKKPEGKKTSDFNDLFRVEGLGAVRLQIKGAPKRINLEAWTVSNYKGAAPDRRWLIEHTFPLASVGILAAMGDAGKGMLSLDLALKVAADPAPGQENLPFKNQVGLDFNYGAGDAFGNHVRESGAVVIFSAEDDRDEIHRRLEQIDVDGVRFGNLCKKRLIIIPLPNAGGPIPLVVPGRNGPEASPIFFEIQEQLLKIKDLKLVVFDPLASFVAADINADPAVGAFTTGLLSSLATETGAFILIAHHMGKGGYGKAITTAEQARNMIRGTTAIVDGVRAVYTLWPAAESEARRICGLLKERFEPNRVFKGALVKANGPGDRVIKVFVRDDKGLLIAKNEDLDAVKMDGRQILDAIAQEIKAAAIDGHPFTRAGNDSSLYAMRHVLTKQLQNLSRDNFRDYLKILLEEGTVCLCRYRGSGPEKYLDVDGGPFASGEGQLDAGAHNATCKGGNDDE